MFRVKFLRPFWKTDSFSFTVNSYDEINTDSLKNINKSARNIKDVKLINDEGTNIYDLFKYKNVLMTTSSTKKIQERVLNEKN